MTTLLRRRLLKTTGSSPLALAAGNLHTQVAASSQSPPSPETPLPGDADRAQRMQMVEDPCQVRRSNYGNFTRAGNTFYMPIHFWPGD